MDYTSRPSPFKNEFAEFFKSRDKKKGPDEDKDKGKGEK